LELKKPLTLDEQVKRLVDHKMDVADTNLARRILSEMNYYRFTGYALQFRDENNPDDYIPGTKFETVWRLHQFDTELRCILKSYLDIIELYARSQIAYGFSMAKCKRTPYDQHYEPSNFHNKNSHDDIITSSLDREKENNKDSLFVIHHAEKYEGKMPLWVIVELLSLTNLSKLYSAMYYDEQNAIAKNMGSTRQTLKNHLHCMANLRNKVAHAGRLYNVLYNPPVKLGNLFLKRNPGIYTNTLFAYLIALIRRIPNQKDKSALVMAIINVMTQYADCVQFSLLGFPNNYAQCLRNEIKQTS
jgi:abortive infection bacteriophage resistance protein